MKLYKYILAFFFISLLFASCEDRTDLTEPTESVNTGEANFSKFISIGNSLTAGYQSSALYKSAQIYSYGNLIANQVNTTYEQPIISDPGIGGRIAIKSLEPFSTESQPSTGIPENANLETTYNNLGIPGIVLADVLTTEASPSNYVGVNPLIDVVLRGKGSVLAQALSSQPTLMTIWIGNNDILGYATSGGLRPYTPTEGDVTFGVLYTQLLGAIAQAGVENVVVANIPDVAAIPFFTTIGGQLLSQGIPAVVGTKSDGSVAQLDLTKNLLTLQASSELAEGKGQSADNPLSNGVILDEDEIRTAKTVIASYNSSINAAASQFGFKLADMHSFFNNIAQNGIVADGVEFSALYISGGLFSLDGVHPSSQGYAIVANKFIEVINSEYSANIPYVNVATIPPSLEIAKRVEFNKLGLPLFEAGTFDSIFY
jgi:lysophospholipase L1-like esterase